MVQCFLRDPIVFIEAKIEKAPGVGVPIGDLGLDEVSELRNWHIRIKGSCFFAPSLHPSFALPPLGSLHFPSTLCLLLVLEKQDI